MCVWLATHTDTPWADMQFLIIILLLKQLKNTSQVVSSCKIYIDSIEQNWICNFAIDILRGLSSFGNIATFKNGQISLSDHGLYVHGHQKI